MAAGPTAPRTSTTAGAVPDLGRALTVVDGDIGPAQGQGDGHTLTVLHTDIGKLLGKHRKQMPTALGRLVWGQGDGSTLTVLHTDIGKIGAVICWENYMPLVADGHVRQGCATLLRPHGGRPRHLG
jgi:predicted amidohydrolase